MPIPETLCCLALNQLDGIAAVVKILQVGASVVGDRMTDQSRAILDALDRSNRKAWKALEVALAGETLWTRLDRAEVKALRAQIRGFLDEMPLPELEGKAAFRRQCVGELREAHKKGVLLGNLVAGELAEKTGRFAGYSNPADLLQAEKKALSRLGREVQDAGFRTLGWLLAQPAHAGQSVVVVAARYFFRREVETNPELFRGIQFAAVESLTESQRQGFQGLEGAIAGAADRLEQALSEAAAEILAAVAAVHADVKATHETAKAVHESVQSLAADLQAQMAAVLAKLDMANKPVQPEHSMAIRTDRERELVRELLRKVRAAPDAVQPALAGEAGKLQVAIGDFAGAAASFETAARGAFGAGKAEAYHNAYRAKLEQKDYAGAVADLNRAVALDPARFAPFPTDKYELVRILGAGGFGVTFHCKHTLTGGAVAVKSLTDSNLDQDVGAVLREATALDKLKHRAIIGLRDCGYADAANRRRPYLVMEYFDGQTLQEYVEKRGVIPLADALPLARTLAEALAAAHGQNVLHRDVKPANVMVKRTPLGWDVRLIDFGLAMRSSLLAESVSTARGHTMLGSSIAGTLDYAAPEQLGKLPGAKVGPPADVYGFAKTLCFALFQTTEPTIKHYKSVPEALAELIGRCLSRDPKERPQTFQQVLLGLDTPRPTPRTAPPPDDDEIEERPKPAKPARKPRRDDDDDDYEHDHRRRYDDDDDYYDRRGPSIDTFTRLTHAAAAFFLGVLGVHKFIQGNRVNGWFRLLLALGPFVAVCVMFGMDHNANPPVFFACLVMGMPVIGLIGFIESLKYLTMPNDSYAREYLVKKKSWF